MIYETEERCYLMRNVPLLFYMATTYLVAAIKSSKIILFNSV